MIYLDNSATTRVSEAAAEKMLYAARECWGNPSSLHEFGLNAERLLSEARASVMDALGAGAVGVSSTNEAVWSL